MLFVLASSVKRKWTLKIDAREDETNGTHRNDKEMPSMEAEEKKGCDGGLHSREENEKMNVDSKMKKSQKKKNLIVHVHCKRLRVRWSETRTWWKWKRVPKEAEASKRRIKILIRRRQGGRRLKKLWREYYSRNKWSKNQDVGWKKKRRTPVWLVMQVPERRGSTFRKEKAVKSLETEKTPAIRGMGCLRRPVTRRLTGEDGGMTRRLDVLKMVEIFFEMETSLFIN